MWKQALGSLCAALTVGACADAGPTAPENLEVFRNPQNFVGKQVRLCGYIRDAFEDGSIWASPRETDEVDGLRLGFISDRDPKAPGPWHGQTRCVTGEIVRTGCAEENVCFWSSVPYALRVR